MTLLLIYPGLHSLSVSLFFLLPHVSLSTGGSPCRSPVFPYEEVDCAVIIELAGIALPITPTKPTLSFIIPLSLPIYPVILEEAHMQERARAHAERANAEQLGGT